MLFSDLCSRNKDWDDSTVLAIISKNEAARSICVRAALPFFGSRPVVWFADCVVMLL